MKKRNRMMVALLIIGGIAAYLHYHALYTAYHTPVIAPAVPTQSEPAAPPIAGAGTLPDGELVLAQISYGAPVDEVREIFGAPQKKKKKEHPQFPQPIEVYDYTNSFELTVADGIVQQIVLKDYNGLATKRGISIGSAPQDVEAAYGPPNVIVSDHYIYRAADNPKLGLDFQISEDMVEQITCGLLD